MPTVSQAVIPECRTFIVREILIEFTRSASTICHNLWLLEYTLHLVNDFEASKRHYVFIIKLQRCNQTQLFMKINHSSHICFVRSLHSIFCLLSSTSARPKNMKFLIYCYVRVCDLLLKDYVLLSILRYSYLNLTRFEKLNFTIKIHMSNFKGIYLFHEVIAYS